MYFVINRQKYDVIKTGRNGAPSLLHALRQSSSDVLASTTNGCHPSWWSVCASGCARLASAMGSTANAQHRAGMAITQLMPRAAMRRPMAAGTIIEVAFVLPESPDPIRIVWQDQLYICSKYLQWLIARGEYYVSFTEYKERF